MTTLHQAKQAVLDNHNYIDPKTDPKTHNINVGLNGIIESLIRIERQLGDMDQRLQRLERR